MTGLDVQGLRSELERRSGIPITFHHWDPFILDETDQLKPEILPAGDLARRESERWSGGRFDSIPLCIADAVFSKQREYLSVVKSAIRPFADAFKKAALEEFVATPWADVFRRTFGKEPRDPDAPRHSHLSPEGRIRSIHGGSRVFLDAGLRTPTVARQRLANTVELQALKKLVLRVNGIGEALFDETCMSLGHLTVKADMHVRRVLAPFLGLAVDDPATLFVDGLERNKEELGMSPFVVDQIIWYTESASGKGGA